MSEPISTRYMPGRTSDGRGVLVFVETGKDKLLPANVKSILAVTPGEATNSFPVTVAGKAGTATKAWLRWTLDDIRALFLAEQAGLLKLVTGGQIQDE